MLATAQLLGWDVLVFWRYQEKKVGYDTLQGIKPPHVGQRFYSMLSTQKET